MWNHPDAERLYCEEIDVGEDAPRQIASGLREHYALGDMQASVRAAGAGRVCGGKAVGGGARPSCASCVL